jgi:hypothetical protein
LTVCESSRTFNLFESKIQTMMQAPPPPEQATAAVTSPQAAMQQRPRPEDAANYITVGFALGLLAAEILILF